MKNFKIDNVRFFIKKRFTDCEINIHNPKYDVLMFSDYYKAWVRIGSCMTLAGGRELAENHMATLALAE